MDCLENVIKLSRTTCECFEEGKPEDYNQGKTEVYLDELEGITLNVIGAGANCQNLWQMMALARTNATLALKADLLGCIENNFVPKRPNYSGKLGQQSFTSSLSISEPVAGQIMKFQNIVGGKAVINRIGLIMSATQAISISVYDNDEHKETPLGTYTINSSANNVSFGTLLEPLELPLWSRNVSDLEYYFVYTISGFQPKNNKHECIPCSGGVKNVIWNNWVSIYGIQGTGTEYGSFNRSEYLNGLLLDVTFKCDSSRVLCSDEYPIDFTTGRGLHIAYAIRYKAGDILLNEILSSPEINRYTMMDREALYGKRNWCRKNYEDYVKYLCENTPIINNDCWVCKPNHLLKRGTILA